MPLVTTTFAIAANADDVRRNGAAFADDAAEELGNFGGSLASALRFTAVTIPRNATIRRAYVQGQADGVYTVAGCNVIVRGELAANPGQIVSTADWDARVDTVASVLWSAVPSFATGIRYDTPDISAVLQEIVNQTNWAVGNSLNIYLEDNASTASAIRKFVSRNASATAQPTLTVEYYVGEALTVVKFRDPRPPHGEVLTELVPDVRYSFKVRRTGTTAFRLARTSPNVASFLSSMLTPEPAMVTIERSDGYLPWVGFVTQYDASQEDPDVLFQCADHSWRLAAPHGARTLKQQFYKAAGGRIIKDIFRDMEDRAEPQPLLLYDNVGDGPLANQEVRADYGLDVLATLAKQTNYEWGFSYNVEKHRVETHLSWVGRLGVDRRNEEIWSEQKHFTAAGYTLTYANGIKAALAVGGSGVFSARPAAIVNASGRTSEPSTSPVTVFAKTPVSAYGLGGTRTTVTEQITDKNVLRQQAIQLHEAPEFAVEQLRLTLFEAAIDMSRFALGDVRTVRLQTTSLGNAIERVVRIIGIQMIPQRAEIEVEVIVVG